MRKASPFSRRRFLKAGSLFVPAALARGQSLNLADLPFIASSGSSGICANTSAWVARVVANGGATPAVATQNALCTFDAGITAASLGSKIISLNAFVPDSLIASKTPYYQNAGLSLWTTNGAGDSVNVNGWQNNGAGAWLDTGVNPATAFADTNIGLTIYQFTLGATNTASIGNWSDVTSQCCMLRGREREYFSMDTGGDTGSTGAPAGGYISANRIATNDARVFYANSTHAHAQVGSYLSNNASAARAVTFAIAGAKTDSGDLRFGSVNQAQFSLAAITKGLTSAESASLYPLVQALRTALGGGYV